MRVSGWQILALLVLAWLVGSLLLGGSSGGVYMGSTEAADAANSNQHQPRCVSAHVFDVRGWGGFETIRYDVWVDGCVDTNGRLQLDSAPRCSAKSFLGPGTVTCIASPAGSRQKVTVNLTYPYGLEHLAGFPNPSTFYIDPGGGYSTY